MLATRLLSETGTYMEGLSEVFDMHVKHHFNSNLKPLYAHHSQMSTNRVTKSFYGAVAPVTKICAHHCSVNLLTITGFALIKKKIMAFVLSVTMFVRVHFSVLFNMIISTYVIYMCSWCFSDIYWGS